jgi:hypothetical protein
MSVGISGGNLALLTFDPGAKFCETGPAWLPTSPLRRAYPDEWVRTPAKYLSACGVCRLKHDSFQAHRMAAHNRAFFYDTGGPAF